MTGNKEIPLFDIRNQAHKSHWSDDYLIPTLNPTGVNNDLFVFNLARRPYQLQMYGIKKLSDNFGGNPGIGLAISQPMSVIINYASEHLRHPEESEWQHLGRGIVRTGVDYVAGNFIPLYRTITFSAEVANYYWEKYGGTQELYKFENLVFDELFQDEITHHLGNGLSPEAKQYLALVYGDDLFEARRESLQQWQFWANIHKARSAVIECTGDVIVGAKKHDTPVVEPVAAGTNSNHEEAASAAEWNYEPFVQDTDSKSTDEAILSTPKLDADFSDAHLAHQRDNEPASGWGETSFYVKPIPNGIQVGITKTHIGFGNVSVGVNIDANALGFISNLVKQIFGKRKVEADFEVCGEKYRYQLKKISGFACGNVKLTLTHDSGTVHERWFKLDWRAGELCLAPDNLNREVNKSLIEENLNNALASDLQNRIPGKIHAFNTQFNKLLDEQEYDKANELCDTFFIRYKDVPEIRGEESGFRSAITKSKDQNNAAELFEFARAKVNEGKLTDAIAKFKEAQALCSDNADIIIGLADAYVRNEQFEFGIDQARKAVELDASYAGVLQQFQRQYREYLLLDPNKAIENITVIKRCYENSVDADESERWLRALHSIYMLTSDMTSSISLLKGWLDEYPDHKESDNVRLVLAKVQCLNDEPLAAEASFSQLKSDVDPMSVALYFNLHQDAQTRIQYSKELARDPAEMLQEMAQLPVKNGKASKTARKSADLAKVPKVNIKYKQKMFEADPDNFRKFMVYVMGLFNEEANSGQVSATFKRFHSQKLGELSDNEILFYHQLLRKANIDGLLDEDAATNTYKRLATDAAQAIMTELPKAKVADLSASTIRAGNDERHDAGFVANHYKELAFRFSQAMIRLKAAVEEGNANEQNHQLERAHAYLMSMLDATAPEAKIKFLSNSQLAEWATDLESVLDNDKCFLAKHDVGIDKKTLVELKRIYKTGIGLVKVQAGMRIAKFHMDGVETLQFILPFVSKSVDISRDWQFHIDSVLEAMSRFFQMKSTVPGLQSGYAELQQVYLLLAGGLRIWRNFISADAEDIGADSHQEKLYHFQSINRLSLFILATDMSYFSLVNRGTVSNLQKLSFGYQIFSLFNNFFEQWEYERVLNQDISDPTLFSSVWIYDVLRATSGSISRNAYLMSVMYGQMFYNSALFLAHAAGKLGVMTGKLSGEFVLKEGVEQFVESLTAKFTAGIAGKTGVLGVESGLKILPKLTKAVSYILIASLVYDVASLLGFNWESRQLQKVAAFIKGAEYEKAEAALKEFDEEYWYQFHHFRAQVAEGIYYHIFGSKKGHEVYRLNKIFVLRELLSVSIELSKKNSASRELMLTEALEKMLNFANNPDIFNEKLPDYNDTFNSFDDVQASLYRLFVTSHYDVHKQDGFALNIRLIALSAFMLLKTGQCDLTSACSDTLDDLLHELSRLDFSGEQERDEYLLKLDNVHEFLVTAAARGFWESSACRTYGLSTRCEKDFQQFQARRDNLPVENDEIEKRLRNLDKEVLAYRLDRAFEAFGSHQCDISSDCEARLNRLDNILLRYDAGIRSHGLEDKLERLRDQTSAHRAYGAMQSMQKIPCDLSDETLKRATMFSQRIQNAKAVHYQLDSDIRSDVDRVNARCYTEADIAYSQLESQGVCLKDSPVCDAGLKNLYDLLDNLPWNNKALSDRFDMRVQGYAINRLSQTYSNLESARQKGTDDILSRFSDMRRVLEYTNKMLASTAAHAGLGSKYLHASQQLVLANGLQAFKSVNVNLAYPADKEYRAYQVLHQAIGSTCTIRDGLLSLFLRTTSDSEQLRHERNLECLDEMASIHHGRLSSLWDTFSCPESKQFFARERLDFFNTMADLVIRSILVGVPLSSSIFSRIPYLNRFTIDTQSMRYKLFDSLLAIAREVILYSVAYQFSSAYPSLLRSASCQGLSQCISTNFIEQLGLLRLSLVLLNRGMDEELDFRFGFSKNFFLVPRIMLSAMMSIYYFSMTDQSFFMTYIFASQLGNVFEYGLRYMKYNHPNTRVGWFGWFAKNFTDEQRKIVFKGLELAYFAYSISSMLPTYSKALMFYNPIANFCLPPVSLAVNTVNFSKTVPVLGSTLLISSDKIASIASLAAIFLPYAGYAFLLISLVYVVKSAFDQAENFSTKYGQLNLRFEGIEQNKAVYLLSNQMSRETIDGFNLVRGARMASSRVELPTLDQSDNVSKAGGFNCSFMNQSEQPPLVEPTLANLWGSFTSLYSRLSPRDSSLEAASKAATHITPKFPR